MSISIWISIVALIVATTSLVNGRKNNARLARTAAVEKRSEAFAALVAARFTVSQVGFRLLTLEPYIRSEGSGDVAKLHEFIAEAKSLEARVESDIQALYTLPLDVEAIENHWEQATGNLAAIKQALEGIEMFERYVRGQ